MSQIAAVEPYAVIEPSEVTVVPVGISTTQPRLAHAVASASAVQTFATATTTNGWPSVGQVMAQDWYPEAAD